MNLKELLAKPEKFSAGHRACRGCPMALIVRQVLRATDCPVVVANATGCLEVISTIYPQTAWQVPWIHNAFENAPATISGVVAAYNFLKKINSYKFKDNSLLIRDLKFVVFAGDGSTYDIGLQALSGVWERGEKFVYVCYDNQAYMNCLSTSSLIMTEKGLKKITDIKRGDKIYAFDQKNYQLVLKKCARIVNNGKRGVFELETLHHSIKATGNHPFLILKRNGRGKKNNFIWKMLNNIKVGDEVVVLKSLDQGKSFEFKFKKVKKGDHKVNNLNEINLPKYSSADLMKYLGIYVGDGWVRVGRGEVGFALPKNSQARKILFELHSKIFGSKTRSDEMYVYINSVNLARFIDSLDFGSGARNKTIPDWIFTLPKEEKESFVQGLMLSDGYKHGNSWRYVSASNQLLRSLRLLLQTIGFRVGKIHWQIKRKGTKCVNRTLLKDSKYGYICFSKRRKWNVEKYPSQYRHQNFLIENKYFEIEKVRSIRSVGREPTLDLAVEGEHNFIADGIVVHNTGVQRSSATPFGASTTTTPVGKVLKGKMEQRKDIVKIALAHRLPYIAQTAVHAWQDLYQKAKKAFETDGPSFLNILSPCVLGWRYDSSLTVEISKLAAETCFWPLYEIENSQYKLNYQPKEKLPLEKFIQGQRRFAHFFKPENKDLLAELQTQVDKDWQDLLKLSTN